MIKHAKDVWISTISMEHSASSVMSLIAYNAAIPQIAHYAHQVITHLMENALALGFPIVYCTQGEQPMLRLVKYASPTISSFMAAAINVLDVSYVLCNFCAKVSALRMPLLSTMPAWCPTPKII